jgi:hypothetical protein
MEIADHPVATAIAPSARPVPLSSLTGLAGVRDPAGQLGPAGARVIGLPPARGQCTCPPPRSHARRAVLRGATLGRVRISDAFWDLGPALSDGDFLLRCSCGTEQRLDEMTIDACGEITLYDCVRCQSSMAGVLADNPDDELWAPAPMTRRQEQGGHRRNGYVVGSKVDIALRPPGEDADVLLIPATPSFFAQYRYL